MAETRGRTELSAILEELMEKERISGLSPLEEHLLYGEIEPRIRLACLADYQRMKEDGIRDPRTGLYNSRFFNEALQHEIAVAVRTKKPVSLILIDGDDFGEINKRLGMPTGDEFLIEAARRLERGKSRRSDILARLGGDEFVFLLPGTGVKGARHLASMVELAMKDPFILGECHSVKKSFSIGIATFPNHTEGGLEVEKAADQLVERADLAMRSIKKARKKGDTRCIRVFRRSLL